MEIDFNKMKISTVKEEPNRYYMVIFYQKQYVKERIPLHVYNMEDRAKRDSLLKEYVIKVFRKAKTAWGPKRPDLPSKQAKHMKRQKEHAPNSDPS